MLVVHLPEEGALGLENSGNDVTSAILAKVFSGKEKTSRYYEKLWS
ncbi:hypothetical protein HanHA300_Chr13g0487201 [Helianthus annuus]|nr:hypothetical protein HanHA300_Chr13g0487201 [Helianthus annuus]KAJ0498164.1 hypothetical protein HanHA89_Chr13g0519371 [Helianthus annuus]KAJ0664165.1 hypothetical protein HanLR1_Chr13g0489211 [Helianthus annuus]KAJ0671649.1 hypothetical protein HanOQP8_Chr13g0487931 [Helianthus annuus]